ncbi:MAG: hypothetical protein HYY20_07440 [Candidatus Tectomicrobia bacterium]|uniref:Chemotaxis receptor methyltransferase CheR N-terminal domain-containing protein n=1 Tax=Tectimicrobiota bacterium TaxID=2528274 RepID=A0A932CP08_UNCTE|nr:hypothetical protein [Candidatus Tectomicrobia bacterium]
MIQPGSEQELETLLLHLKTGRGFDFTGYKRSSLMRRIRKRMQMVSVERFLRPMGGQ